MTGPKGYGPKQRRPSTIRLRDESLRQASTQINPITYSTCSSSRRGITPTTTRTDKPATYTRSTPRLSLFPRRSRRETTRSYDCGKGTSSSPTGGDQAKCCGPVWSAGRSGRWTQRSQTNIRDVDKWPLFRSYQSSRRSASANVGSTPPRVHSIDSHGEGYGWPTTIHEDSVWCTARSIDTSTTVCHAQQRRRRDGCRS